MRMESNRITKNQEEQQEGSEKWIQHITVAEEKKGRR